MLSNARTAHPISQNKDNKEQKTTLMESVLISLEKFHRGCFFAVFQADFLSLMSHLLRHALPCFILKSVKTKGVKRHAKNCNL